MKTLELNHKLNSHQKLKRKSDRAGQHLLANARANMSSQISQCQKCIET